MDHLSILSPDGKRSRYDIQRDNVQIGRATAADLVLQDSHVSKVHAALTRTTGGYLLRDLHSSNGTFVNDRRLAGPMILKPGDRIRVGKSTLVLNPERSDQISLSDRPFQSGRETVAFPAAGLEWSDPKFEIEPVGRSGETPGDWTPPSFPGLGTSHRLPSSGEVVAEVNRRLFGFRPLAEMLDEVMKIASEAIAYERGVLILFDGDDARVAAWHVPDGDDPTALTVSRGIIDHVRRTREAVLTVDAGLDVRFSENDSLAGQGVRSVMCVPLLAGDEVRGVIYTDSRRRAGLFQEHALRLLTLLANLAAEKIEGARRVEQLVSFKRVESELREAASIQRFLLPTLAPPVPGYDVDGGTFPCYQVGGDYFDYIPQPGGCLAIVLADVSGKGLPAALLMSNFQSGIRILGEIGLPLGEMTARLNAHLCRSTPENKYITFFCGVLDPRAHTLTFVNAGHVPALIVRKDGSVEKLAMREALPLGMFESFSCAPETVRLGNGDTLVCYSDGVTEATAPDGRMFGEDRLARVVVRSRDLAPADLVTQILSAVDDHCGSGAHQDDITVVVLRRVD